MVEKKQVFNWPPLESDPGILTEYMQKLGMSKEWELAEVIGLEPDFLAMVPKSTVALILAFDHTASKEEEKKEKKKSPVPEVDYYMWQTSELDNACGLIACIHAVFNNLGKVKVLPGTPLEKFLAKSLKQTPEERAKTLDNFTEIQEAHQECGLEGQSNLVEEPDQTKYHFICFTRNPKGDLVELDGVVGEPILLKGTLIRYKTNIDKCEEENFLKTVADEIMDRLAKGKVSERMALMALCPKS